MSREFGDSMAFPPVCVLPGLSPIPSAALRPFALVYTGAYTGSVSPVSLECWRPSIVGRITRTPSLNPESCNKPLFPAGRRLERGQLACGRRTGSLVFNRRGSRLEGGAYCHSWGTEPMDSRGSDAGSRVLRVSRTGVREASDSRATARFVVA